MLRTAALAALACGAAAADMQGATPLLATAGGTYLGTDLRKALETDWGVAGGLSAMLGESGVLGLPSLDVNVRYAPDGDGSFLSFESGYAERMLIAQQTWLGFGFGGNFVRLKLDETPLRAAASERRWQVGGKAMLGFLLTDRFFVEGTYHYTREALGLNTSSATIALGYWF